MTRIVPLCVLCLLMVTSSVSYTSSATKVSEPLKFSQAISPKFYCFLDTAISNRSTTMLRKIIEKKKYHIAGQQWKFYWDSQENRELVEDRDVVCQVSFFYGNMKDRNSCGLMTGIALLLRKYEVNGISTNHYMGWHHFSTTTGNGGYPEEENYNNHTQSFLNALTDWYNEYK